MKFEPFCDIEATFKPKRTDDLKPGVAEWIGKRGTWTWAGVQDEDEQYAGLVTFMWTGVGCAPFAWVPECDLSDIRIIGLKKEKNGCEQV